MSSDIERLRTRVEEHRYAAEKGGYEPEHEDWCLALDLVEQEIDHMVDEARSNALAQRLYEDWIGLYGPALLVTLTYRPDARKSLAQWDSLHRRHRESLWRRWRWENEGIFPPALWSVEMGALNTPNLHLAIPFNMGGNRPAMQRWLEHAWGKITGDRYGGVQVWEIEGLENIRAMLDYLVKNRQARRVAGFPVMGQSAGFQRSVKVRYTERVTRITPVFTLDAADNRVDAWQLATLLGNCLPFAGDPDANPFHVYAEGALHHFYRADDGSVHCWRCDRTPHEIISIHTRITGDTRYNQGRCPGHVCDGQHPGAGLYYAGEPDPLPVNDGGVVDTNKLLDGDAISQQRAWAYQAQRQAEV